MRLASAMVLVPVSLGSCTIVRRARAVASGMSAEPMLGDYLFLGLVVRCCAVGAGKCAGFQVWCAARARSLNTQAVSAVSNFVGSTVFNLWGGDIVVCVCVAFARNAAVVSTARSALRCRSDKRIRVVAGTASALWLLRPRVHGASAVPVWTTPKQCVSCFLCAESPRPGNKVVRKCLSV